MEVLKFISWCLRVVAWPILVIVALNIESLLTDRGLERLIVERWDNIAPAVEFLFSLIASPYLLYPIVFILGGSFFEWAIFRIYADTKFNDRAINKKTKSCAVGIVSAFKEDGFTRRLQVWSKYGALLYMNDLLEKEKLPRIPENFGSGEHLNKMYAEYLRFISEGERALAFQFHERIIAPSIPETNATQPLKDESPQSLFFHKSTGREMREDEKITDS